MHKLSSVMSKEVFKAPKMKKPQQMKRTEVWSPARKRKAKNRFLSFCDIVLEYTQYENMRQEDLRTHNTSPLDSGGSTAESLDSLVYPMDDDGHRTPANRPSYLSESSPESGTERPSAAYEDSFESITCFCRKPFAGRPMIECNKCLTWIHLSCAKIRRNNIPDEFTCQHCREARNNARKRKSNRMRIDKTSSPSASSPSPAVPAAPSHVLSSPATPSAALS